ncbi:MAG: hypothetical protein AAF715_01445 [Myxococcota bacterium]
MANPLEDVVAQSIISPAFPITPDALAREVGRMTDRPQDADLDRQLAVVVSLLGSRLSASDADAAGARLAPGLRASLRPTAPALDPSAASFASALVDRVEPAVARATCTALAEAMDEQGRCHLRLAPLRSWLLVS